jgi:hypothetical protein
MELEGIVRPFTRLIKHGAVIANEGLRFICVNGQSHARAALTSALAGWGAGRAPQHVWALRTVIAYRIETERLNHGRRAGNVARMGYMRQVG